MTVIILQENPRDDKEAPFFLSVWNSYGKGKLLLQILYKVRAHGF